MCESAIFFGKDGSKTEMMRDTVRLMLQETDIVCTDIMGNEKVFKNVEIKDINMIDHSIIIKKIE